MLKSEDMEIIIIIKIIIIILQEILLLQIIVLRPIISSSLLPDEQKGCRRGGRGTKDQLLIDKMIMKNCKRRQIGLGMAWVDYKKAYYRL